MFSALLPHGGMSVNRGDRLRPPPSVDVPISLAQDANGASSD